MKKKLCTILSFIFLFFFAAVSDVHADIRSVNDLKVSLNKLDELAQQDLLSFVHRNEIIGYRLDNFKMCNDQYQKMVYVARDNIRSNLDQVEIVMNNVDFSDTEKDMQLNQIFHNSDSVISDLNSKTINYVVGLRNCLPSVTYQQYIKKFQNYYNELNLSNMDLNVR